MDRDTRGSVLVVDDEPTITEIVARYLTRAGYRTETALTGRDALAAAARDRPDLVVLDLMLPGMSGLEVMRRLRAAPAAPAVILLTARGEESDRVVGLRLGADDYVVKPFSPAELVARVDAVLRRLPPSLHDEPPLVAGELRIDPAARTLTRDGEPVALTQREFDLLLFLARHPLRAFSREQLMGAVWEQPAALDTSTVTVHVRRLRAKLAGRDDTGQPIETVWGVGYRFAP